MNDGRNRNNDQDGRKIPGAAADAEAILDSLSRAINIYDGGIV